MFWMLKCIRLGYRYGDRPPPRRAPATPAHHPPPRPVLSVELLPLATGRFWWAPLHF
ncbi:hypothetical protein Hanom_Chr16g01438221 [Helianthus anomalus]